MQVIFPLIGYMDMFFADLAARFLIIIASGLLVPQFPLGFFQTFLPLAIILR